MTTRKKSTPYQPGRRNFLKGTAAAIGLSVTGFPALSFARDKPIRIGMPSIFSGQVAAIGITSSNAAKMEIEKFNAAGGFNGRPLELITRDTKAQPAEAARVARELIHSDGCDFLVDATASSGAFAVHEVARDLGVLCIHTNSETSKLTADPALRLPNAFRCARQGIHDSIVGGAYAARVAEETGLTEWMSISPDYAYGRDTTAQFFEYAQHFNGDITVVGHKWPKLGQPSYTTDVTALLRERPDAIYSCLWGGDLSSFVKQANTYGLFRDPEFFAVNMADYTVLSALDNMPEGIHSGNRYLKSFPATAANAAWANAYHKKFGGLPTDWSWQNATAINFLTEAMKRTNSDDGDKIAGALPGMTIESPFAVDGKITMRAEDHTIVSYAIGWGVLDSKPPYMPNPSPGDWSQIFELETAWKKSKGYL